MLGSGPARHAGAISIESTSYAVNHKLILIVNGQQIDDVNQKEQSPNDCYVDAVNIVGVNKQSTKIQWLDLAKSLPDGRRYILAADLIAFAGEWRCSAAFSCLHEN